MSITARLWNKSLQALKEKKFDDAELRLSESNGCQRKRLFKAIGMPTTHQDSDVNLGVLQAGHILEAQVVALYEQSGITIETQQEIILDEFGASGHMDVWLPDLPLIVECKSTSIAQAGDLPKEDHLMQVQAYLHFFGRHNKCLDAEIVYIFRENLNMVAFPVRYNPAIGQAIEERLMDLRQRAELLKLLGFEEVLASPLLPPLEYSAFGFPCRFVTQGVMVFCPYYGHCHGRREETAVEAPTDAIAERIIALASAKAEAKAAGERAKELEAKAKILEAELHELLDRLKLNEVKSGPVKFKRTWVEGRTSYAIDKAVAAGMIEAAVLEPYTSTGKGYWRVTVG